MKNIDLILAAIFSLFFIIGTIVFLHNTHDSHKVIECTQKTIEYTGFDGEKHQAIIVKTGQNWILVEKK